MGRLQYRVKVDLNLYSKLILVVLDNVQVLGIYYYEKYIPGAFLCGKI